MSNSTKIPRAAKWVLGIMVVLALTRDLISNGIPLRCQIAGQTFYPGLQVLWKSPDAVFAHPVLDSIRIYKAWKTFSYDVAPVFAPIAFSAGEKDSAQLAKAPGCVQTFPNRQFRHWLGTDEQGRDVAAGMVAGARVAMLAGSVAMSLALLLGLLLGSVAGFYGDDRLRVRAGVWYLGGIGLVVAFLFAFVQRQYVLRFYTSGWQWLQSTIVFIGISLLFRWLGVLLSKIPYFSRVLLIPADMLIMRLAELFKALPLMVLLLALIAILKTEHTFWILIAMIGIFSWPDLAMFIRADMLRVRALDFIAAARGMGYREAFILWRHALPNAMRSVLILCAFGFGAVILLEASLSFLGLGGPSTAGASWGSFLARGDVGFRYWWISLPAACAICATILALNSIGEALSRSRKE
jgi:peptide/nickel transport system permease protein